MHIRFASALTIGTVSLILGCRSAEPDSAQATFASPEQAFDSLIEAARGDGSDALVALLGPDGSAIIDMADPIAARRDRDVFVELYDSGHSTVENADGSHSLIVGDGDWPFPVPVVLEDESWRFDAVKGLDEILDRRIGRNELSAIEVCRAVGDAQSEFWSLAPSAERAYAMKFFSDTGQRNGLHWKTEADGIESPLGALVTGAADQGYDCGETDEPSPYHGYHYALLTAQGSSARGGAKSYIVDGRMSGGFAIVAWPAQYGESGVMTFLMDERGIVFECDLGEETAEIAAAMDAFDPDSDWTVCRD